MSVPRRVVSLLPAATEMVCALGAGDRLVGRSHECDVPPQVSALPVCSRPRAPLEGPVAVIDDRVRDLVRHGLSVFEVDAQRLRDLQPDLIITQTQCEVCAVSLAEVEAAVRTWSGTAPAVLSLEATALRDVLADVQRVADALGCPQEGQRLRAEMRTRMRAIDGTANGVAGAPTVVCIEWVEPLMVAGNWVPELVDLAGGDDRLGTPGEHSPVVAWERVREADPDVLVVMPCGFDLARSCETAGHLRSLPGYGELRAAACGEVYATDGHRYFNRPGPSLVESLEILAEIFHPQRFDFGHEDEGWKRAAR
jgi:iron complex transport system substrate-binding protein